MLFVHGFPEFWYEWHNQLDEFGKDHQAVALDMRGYNLSSKPTDVAAYRAKHLIEDLRALIEHLGHKKCIVVAHDWGGAAAWTFAANYPDYVEKLVIINAPHTATFARELTSQSRATSGEPIHVVVPHGQGRTRYDREQLRTSGRDVEERRLERRVAYR